MHRPPQRQPVAAAVAQLAGGLALIVGVPVLLATLFRWPLPTEVPTWDTLTSTPLRFVDSAVILNAFVCAAWLCWAILTIYTALGILDSLCGRPGRPHRIVPLATLAGKITASVLMLASLTRPVTVAALPALPVSVTAEVSSRPPDGVLPTGGTTTATSSPGTTAAQPSADPIYEVKRGDTLWDIAERQLGDPFRWTEIRDLNPQLFANPNLICSGWKLTLPHDAALPPADEALPAPVSPPASVSADPPDVESDEPAATTTIPTPDSPASAAGPDNAAVGASGDDTADSKPTPLAVLANVTGVAGATVLATGLVVALRRRRRRRSPRPMPFSAPSDLERALVATGDLALVRWVGQELAHLGELITGQGRVGVPVVVEFSEESGLEILWDQPTLDPPPPWDSDSEGWSWRVSYDPDQPVAVAERPSVLPALVTIGQRGDRQLMVNLEAFGALALVGSPDDSKSLLRAMLLELASSDEIAHARVVAVDPSASLRLPEDLLVATVDEHEAVALIDTAVAEATHLLEEVDCTTTFGYRTFTAPVLPTDVTIVGCTSDSTTLTVAAGGLRAHRGVAAIVLGGVAGIEHWIVLGSDGSATLEPFGIRFIPAAVTGTTAALIADLLNEEATPTDTPQALVTPDTAEEPVQLEAWWLDTDGGDAVLDLRDPDPDRPPVSETATFDRADFDKTAAALVPSEPPLLTIKVLGTPRLAGGPTIGRRELTMVALVACSSRPVTHEQIQDAIWGASPVTSKTVFNLISSARTALGSLEGEPAMSPADRSDNTITLHPRIGTDLKLMQALVTQAELASSSDAIRLLIEALELVEGPPFDAAGYDWAITEQLVSEAEHLIARAAALTTDLALEAGDPARARWAVMQGLRAIPGDETLYRLRMRIEDAAGNPGGVRRAFDELEGHLAEYSLDPSPATRELLRELLGTTAVHRRSLPESD